MHGYLTGIPVTCLAAERSDVYAVLGATGHVMVGAVADNKIEYCVVHACSVVANTSLCTLPQSHSFN
jgi:hypothetical protein